MADPKAEAEAKTRKEKIEKLKADKNYPTFKEFFDACLEEFMETEKSKKKEEDGDFFLFK